MSVVDQVEGTSQLLHATRAERDPNKILIQHKSNTRSGIGLRGRAQCIVLN